MAQVAPKFKMISMYYLTQSLWVRNSEQLSWVVGLVSHEVAAEMSAGTVIVSRLDWDQRLCFQKDSLMWLASWGWLLAGGLGSLPVKPLHRAAWVCSTRLAPFRAHDLTVSRAEWQCLLRPNFGSDTPALLPRSISHTCQPWYILGGNLTSAWIPRSEGHWGAILEATIQYSIFFETQVPCYPENNLAFSRSTSFSWATDFVHSAVGWRLSEC